MNLPDEKKTFVSVSKEEKTIKFHVDFLILGNTGADHSEELVKL